MKKLFFIALLGTGMFVGCQNDDDGAFTNNRNTTQKSGDSFTIPTEKDLLDVSYPGDEINETLGTRKIAVKPCKIWDWKESETSFSYSAIGLGDDGHYYEYVKSVRLAMGKVYTTAVGKRTDKRC